MTIHGQVKAETYASIYAEISSSNISPHNVRALDSVEDFSPGVPSTLDHANNNSILNPSRVWEFAITVNALADQPVFDPITVDADQTIGYLTAYLLDAKGKEAQLRKQDVDATVDYLTSDEDASRPLIVTADEAFRAGLSRPFAQYVAVSTVEKQTSAAVNLLPEQHRRIRNAVEPDQLERSEDGRKSDDTVQEVGPACPAEDYSPQLMRLREVVNAKAGMELLAPGELTDEAVYEILELYRHGDRLVPGDIKDKTIGILRQFLETGQADLLGASIAGNPILIEAGIPVAVTNFMVKHLARKHEYMAKRQLDTEEMELGIKEAIRSLDGLRSYFSPSQAAQISYLPFSVRTEIAQLPLSTIRRKLAAQAALRRWDAPIHITNPAATDKAALLEDRRRFAQALIRGELPEHLFTPEDRLFVEKLPKVVRLPLAKRSQAVLRRDIAAMRKNYNRCTPERITERLGWPINQVNEVFTDIVKLRFGMQFRNRTAEELIDAVGERYNLMSDPELVAEKMGIDTTQLQSMFSPEYMKGVATDDWIADPIDHLKKARNLTIALLADFPVSLKLAREAVTKSPNKARKKLENVMAQRGDRPPYISPASWDWLVLRYPNSGDPRRLKKAGEWNVYIARLRTVSIDSTHGSRYEGLQREIPDTSTSPEAVLFSDTHAHEQLDGLIRAAGLSMDDREYLLDHGSDESDRRVATLLRQIRDAIKPAANT